MNASSPIVKHLVLIGGGHSHLSVLRSFGMNPMPGLAITLISRDIVTPYSGSMPAFFAGQIQHDDMHIDLRPLAQFAGARIIESEVGAIDLERKIVKMTERPDIAFDILSLNTGSRPDSNLIPGADKHAIAVKPINLFLSQWESMRLDALSKLNQEQQFHLAIIGGGPASIELALATQARIAAELGKATNALPNFNITLFSADPQLLTQHNDKVRAFTSTELERRNIAAKLDCRILSIDKNNLNSEAGETISTDCIIYATGAAIPDWPLASGLKASADGFIEVTSTLQSSNYEFVFAAGDNATVAGEPRPKSGVYAVRQGKILAENLRRYATGKSMQKYFPQRRALALLNLADGRAIASRGDLFFAGKSMWRLKHWIDSRFVKKFSDLPEMPARLQLQSGLADKDTEEKLRKHAMRCAGCGAKVASSLLSEVLADLPNHSQSNVLNSLAGVEDASQIQLEDGRILLQSVDYLKSFNLDPWLFTRIAVNHCLSDIYAMGCKPHSALAIVGLPHAERQFQRQHLKEVMTACSTELAANECTLLGGHSAETETLEFGLCVNGFASNGSLLTKAGANVDENLILTKALGTGALLAADMRGLARHEWIDKALGGMLLSNRKAVDILTSHGSKACTDITGFGLAGHLLEMLEASNCDAEIDLQAIPALSGVIACLSKGIVSSLHEDNSQTGDHIHNAQQFMQEELYPLLFDPQTAGGLLFSISRDQTEACLHALQNAGYKEARVIGKLKSMQAEQPGITLT